MSTTRLDQLEVGSALPPLTVRFTRERLVRYAGASTDFNPIHYSDHFAAKMALPGVIAHGMLTMGTALRVVTDWLGDQGTLTSYFVRFTKPVVVPDDEVGAEVTFSANVVAISGSLVTFAVDAVCNEQKVLGAARAEVDLGA